MTTTVGFPDAASLATPAPVQVVRCRTRNWLVELVEHSPHGAKVALACIDDDAPGRCPRGDIGPQTRHRNP